MKIKSIASQAIIRSLTSTAHSFSLRASLASRTFPLHSPTLSLRSLLIALVLLCTSLSSAQVVDTSQASDDAVMPSWGESLAARLGELSEEAERNYYFTGLSVFDLTADSLLYGYNQHKLMRPASTEKVLTATAALDQLGASHSYITRVVAQGEIDPDRSLLDGDIYVIGDFDPMLSTSYLRVIADSIKALGINQISGSILADLSMKDTLALGNGWCWDDEQPYLTPLSLEGKAYQCTRTKINRYHPAQNFLVQLSAQLRSAGISVGSTGITALPSNSSHTNATSKSSNSNATSTTSSTTICTITHTIAQVLQPMMKDSDNLMAESMFFQLAADKKKNISWKDCAKEVEALIAKTGVPTDYAEIADGSGLSLYNYVTPSAQVAVLRYAYRNQHIFRHLYDALPIAGVDGTLAKRMKTGKTNKNVRAKTGTVTGVSSLCGYLTASNGHLIVFSIICNGLRHTAEGREFQDRICEAICE